MSVYDGIRVVDFTQLEQGPAATQILADFGAEVIKVERPGEGEIGRAQQPQLNGMSPHWASVNRNKKSIVLDLKHPGSRDVLHRLVQSSDIVASNFRPGVMERLGLDHATISEINPRIISAYASGYGQTGPYRDHRGQDLAAQAMGGVMALTGSGDGAPTAVGTYVIDYVAAMHFAQGMMLALAARERTGRGQIVDGCLLNSAVAVHLQEASTYLTLGREYPRPPRGIAHSHTSALYARYTCADGRDMVLVGEVFVDNPWQRVSRALDIPSVYASDARFASSEGLVEHGAECYEIVANAVGKFDRDEVLERCRREDLLVAPVNEYPEVFADAQVQHNEMSVDVDRPSVGRLRMVGVPVKLSDTPGTVHMPPPLLGEHGEDVLRALGYDESQIASLRAGGVMGTSA